MLFKLKEYSKESHTSFAFSIQNPSEYYDNTTKYCYLNIALFNKSWWFIIPELFKPKKKWIDTSKESWSKNPKRGYWDFTKRQYGFSFCEDTLHVYYGIQPGSWSSRDKKNSDHTKVFWIPWKNKTFVSEVFFEPNWAFYDVVKPKKKGGLDFEKLHKIQENVPKIKFKFNDFDGEEIIATCYLSCMEWHHGISWCKWLKYFTKPTIRYKLDISFSKEIGYEKGSWKGGTTGHSIEVQRFEAPLEAFKRYGAAKDYYKNHGQKHRGFTNIEIVK